MAQVELIMPKMGESIMEATILKWVKQVGDTVEIDETILEIATDKVDSEVPSPVNGTIAEIKFQENDTVEIGKVIALITTEGEEIQPVASPSVEGISSKDVNSSNNNGHSVKSPQPLEKEGNPAAAAVSANRGETLTRIGKDNRFYSPLVRNIARKENITKEELDMLSGSGVKGRVTKKDILSYLEIRETEAVPEDYIPTKNISSISTESVAAASSISGEVEIIEMDRMRQLIAEHMVRSKKTSPHVTSFVEVDVTNIVNWRNKVKGEFQEKYNEKITYTPIFMDAVIRAIRDFPRINASVDGTKIIVKKAINLGMATALPSGNLIVPVVKNADHFNLVGLTKAVNDLAGRARANKLKPEEIQDGTFTITNVGTFGNVMGTPIINQPQVAILAVGAIRKKPAVVETEYGDLIAVRQMLFLSLSYDHRVVDGFLGGSFLRRIGDYLEAFDLKQTI